MNLQEYKQALKKHLLTFEWLDEKLIDEIVFECNSIHEILLLRQPMTVVSSGFNWERSIKGFDYWNNIQTCLCKEENPVGKLTQPEIQQLLHILRGQLDVVSFHKAMHKEDAADLWETCDKTDKFTSGSFAAFSQVYRAYKEHKQEEKKLVSLITKLKGLK